MEQSELSQYVAGLFPQDDATLEALTRRSLEQGLPAIQVPDELARLLQILLVASRSTSVLEIGTLFGYSAIMMARVLPENGRIVTLEANATHASVARANIAEVGLEHKVEVREGRAAEVLKSLSGEIFDFVFIDADKSGYPEYLQWALRLTRPGSLIVADNLWRRGAVLQPEEAGDDALGAARFNRMLAEESSLVSTIVPTRDGADAASISVVTGSPS